ncbi:MAG: hypothetical protein ACOYIR_04325 [Christensenellales bacterium]|jgi:hypothetical protein
MKEQNDAPEREQEYPEPKKDKSQDDERKNAPLYGIALGMCLGMSLGITLGDMLLGMCIGIMLGAGCGILFGKQ